VETAALHGFGTKVAARRLPLHGSGPWRLARSAAPSSDAACGPQLPARSRHSLRPQLPARPVAYRSSAASGSEEERWERGEAGRLRGGVGGEGQERDCAQGTRQGRPRGFKQKKSSSTKLYNLVISKAFILIISQKSLFQPSKCVFFIQLIMEKKLLWVKNENRPRIWANNFKI
jgi:hypothetical protein